MKISQMMVNVKHCIFVVLVAGAVSCGADSVPDGGAGGSSHVAPMNEASGRHAEALFTTFPTLAKVVVDRGEGFRSTDAGF
ncbi:MAG TPA: hypothetical protein PK156_24875, partial [Polyangium sp.]|nr:hypothetical protein [Polyangium sp.]